MRSFVPFFSFVSFIFFSRTVFFFLPVHVSNKLAQSVLPLDVRLSLYPLIGIAHHGDQEINKHHHRHQHVNAEGELEEARRPFGLVRFYLEFCVRRLTEDGEEQQLDHVYGTYPDCKYVLITCLVKVSYKCARTYAKFMQSSLPLFRYMLTLLLLQTSRNESISSHTRYVCCNLHEFFDSSEKVQVS